MDSKGTAAVRILVTGAAGFVGRHAVKMLHDAMPLATIIASRQRQHGSPVVGASEEITLDVVDEESTRKVINQYRPTHVVHLAAVANSRKADADLRAAWQTNVDGSLNVARAVAESHAECRLLYISSAEVYGAASNPDGPTSEDARLEPLSFYGVTKAAADIALGQMARGGLRVIRMRPFNHTGVGQSIDYMAPSFARQIAAIERGQHPPVITVGNLAAVRDFLDVRDVAVAYVRAIQRFDQMPSGSVLNIASGIPMRVGDVLDELLRLARLEQEVEIRSETSRHRSDEASTRIGDPTRARDFLEWRPCHSMKDTLSWILETARIDAART